MIKTLIFDFGDVFINLDKAGAMQNALDVFKLTVFTPEMVKTNELYEQGLINTKTFLDFYTLKFPHLSETDIISAWNYILKDFPEHRLQFIKQLANDKHYNLVLLSNTNALHIEWIRNHVPFYDDFKASFNQFYLSHEIGLRKPNTNIFDFVLKENQLNPNFCLFIDDTKENTDTAQNMGFHIWNIDEKLEDVTHLFTVKKDLF